MRLSHRFSWCCALVGALLWVGCNADLDAGGPLGGPDGGGLCANCAPPQICSKAGAGCIDPGTCGGDLDCEPGTLCVAGMDGKRTCMVGGKCGGQEAVAEAVPPNLLVVLDRSCSMDNRISGGTKTKWEIAVAALNKLTTDFRGKIRFGLTLFPDTDNMTCAQGNIPIPVGPGREMQIQTLLTRALNRADPNFPDGPCVTNIDTGMDQANSEQALTDPNRQSFTLLVTDGRQAGCSLANGDSGTERIITNLRTMKKVRTFVIGFGDGVDANQLNRFAMAGGTNTFYKAEDQMTLDKALSGIASETLGCDFQLMQSPPNPQQIYVFFENMTRVPRDPTRKNGWDHDNDKNRVTFYGMYCDQLRAGQVKDVDIVFGCDAPTPG